MGKITKRAVTRVAPRFLQSSSYVDLSLWITKYSRERAGVTFSCDHKVARCQERASLPGPLHLGIWYFSSVQSLSRVQLFTTPWIAACQASLFITNSRSSLRFTSIESVMPSSHLILGHPLLLLPSIPPSIRVFSNSHLFAWGGQSIGVSALASFLPKKSQGCSPLEWTGWIFLQSKGLSRVFSNTTVQKHQFFGAQLSSQSNSHIHSWPLEKP